MWLSARGSQPSTIFSNGFATNAILTRLENHGENDGYYPNYGQWWGSQTFILQAGALAVTNDGNSGSAGWFGLLVRGYYVSLASPACGAELVLNTVSVQYYLEQPIVCGLGWDSWQMQSWTYQQVSANGTVPMSATHLMADVYVIANAMDHMVVTLGKNHSAHQAWVTSSGTQPSLSFSSNFQSFDVTHFHYHGDLDNFSPFYGNLNLGLYKRCLTTSLFTSYR